MLAMDQKSPQETEALSAVSLGIHNVYNGIEDILMSLARARRILREHRLVYRVSGNGSTQQIEIIQCRFHYQK